MSKDQPTVSFYVIKNCDTSGYDLFLYPITWEKNSYLINHFTRDLQI